ncbi:MAG: thrombospondin type 3 repeat-containing protein [Fibrobacterales bacterium]
MKWLYKIVLMVIGLCNAASAFEYPTLMMHHKKSAFKVHFEVGGEVSRYQRLERDKGSNSVVSSERYRFSHDYTVMSNGRWFNWYLRVPFQVMDIAESPGVGFSDVEATIVSGSLLKGSVFDAALLLQSYIPVTDTGGTGVFYDPSVLSLADRPLGSTGYTTGHMRYSIGMQLALVIQRQYRNVPLTVLFTGTYDKNSSEHYDDWYRLALSVMYRMSSTIDLYTIQSLKLSRHSSTAGGALPLHSMGGVAYGISPTTTIRFGFSHYSYAGEIDQSMARDQLGSAFGVHTALSFSFALPKDSDFDGIVDTDDKCPLLPEDIDRFNDTDGCPDVDNDGDGIIDIHDQCPFNAEDKDRFNDLDGCPEIDNDMDGLSDAVDRCPILAEDRDGYQDDDGCPEFDNDSDSIADTLDACPLVAEDIDHFEDGDGCPEYDNDKDGIADTLDACPVEPENHNGLLDDDGCPDQIPPQDTLKVLSFIYFEVDEDVLSLRSTRALEYLVASVGIERIAGVHLFGHADSTASFEYNRALSLRRIIAVCLFFEAKGIVKDCINGKPFSFSQPVATNNDTIGRALNRRVEIILYLTL